MRRAKVRVKSSISVEIARLRMEPGDILIVAIPMDLPAGEAAVIHKNLSRFLSKTADVTIVPSGVKLSVLAPPINS